MRLFDYLVFIVAALLYLPRLALFYLYRFLLFISKPGSLFLLPALLGGLFYWQYDFIIRSVLFDWWMVHVIVAYFPDSPLLEPYWYLGFFWVCFTFILYVLTGGKYQPLGTVLSALPRISRPFPPTLRLRLTERKIRPAPVALSVPSLKRRRARRSPDLTSGLGERLKRLLEVPERVQKTQTPPAQSPELQARPAEPENVPQPQAAKVEPEARPKRKPTAPPLPPKART